MTHHDDPDTTTPIDTTTGQAPVERDALAGILFAAYENNGQDWNWLINRPERVDFYYGEKWPEWEIRRWREVADKVLDAGYRRQNVPATPARVSTPDEREALRQVLIACRSVIPGVVADNVLAAGFRRSRPEATHTVTAEQVEAAVAMLWPTYIADKDDIPRAAHRLTLALAPFGVTVADTPQAVEVVPCDCASTGRIWCCMPNVHGQPKKDH